MSEEPPPPAQIDEAQSLDQLLKRAESASETARQLADELAELIRRIKQQQY